MAKTVTWTDGTTWSVDDETFSRTTDSLDAVKHVVWGLEPILARWRKLAAEGDRIDVDAFAPSEDDRAIVTAALERAVETTTALGAEGAGFEDPDEYREFLTKLGGLHRLFATDITHPLPRAKSRR